LEMFLVYCIFSRQDFVSLCLQKDSNKRPTATELLKHPFIRSSKDVSCLTELIDVMVLVLK